MVQSHSSTDSKDGTTDVPKTFALHIQHTKNSAIYTEHFINMKL